MRGKLIEPFLAEIARIDTNAIAQAGGYDARFKSPKVSYPGGVRTSSRKELAPIRVRCQVEDGPWEAQRQQAGGNLPDKRLTLVIHFKALELAGLVDPKTGDPLLRVNDRLLAIYHYRSGELIQKVRDEVPLYATEVRPTAYGLGRRRNLLVVIFDERSQGLVS